ncbi:MAG: sigma-70 family RNA polymerase sigma factor [Actinomycetota bacterium]
MGKRTTAHDADRTSASGALEELYRAEYVGMVRLAFTLVGSNAEAEDLVQDAFVEVSRRLDQIRNPGAYLRSAVVSRCRSALRRRRVMALRAPEPAPGLTVEATELWDVLERLTENQRVAVVLRYYAGYPASEIAKLLDVPAATVRSHLRRGLSTLRKELGS